MRCDRRPRAGLPALVLALAVMALWLTGCVGAFKQWGEETSLVTKSPSYDPATLEHERLGVLSAVVGFGLEGYSLQVSRSLSTALDQSDHAIQVISPAEALSKVNGAGLATEYSAMMSMYVRSGILNQATLEKVGQALHARYVFLPTMAAFSQAMSGRLSFFGLRVFQTRISMLRLSVQLWDTRTGEIVWESSGEATLANEDVREFRIPFEEIAQRLWRRMLLDLWT